MASTRALLRGVGRLVRRSLSLLSDGAVLLDDFRVLGVGLLSTVFGVPRRESDRSEHGKQRDDQGEDDVVLEVTGGEVAGHSDEEGQSPDRRDRLAHLDDAGSEQGEGCCPTELGRR